MKNEAANDCPRELTTALNAHGLLAFFEDCTPAHRREYLKWIAEAKKPETAQKRIDETLKMLRQKKDREDAKARKKP